ncbi:GDP-mannose transporter into the lumen of the Golgi, partial [Podila epigama]
MTAKSSLSNSAAASILAYCSSSILMTVTNKMVLSRFDFHMNFFLLSIQSLTAVVMLMLFKKMDMIAFRNLDRDVARKWFPISLGLVVMIYTGSKSIQYLSIPVYTIFKNLTVILIAYGEVLWFGSRVTPMMLLSFAFMVLSSVIAGWSDITSYVPTTTSTSASSSVTTSPVSSGSFLTWLLPFLSDETELPFNIGYLWIALNCFSSAAYVLYLRKRIKSFAFKDFDTVYYNNLLSFPVMLGLSFCLEGWSSAELEQT